jgi:hypothetical protein
MQCSTVPLTEKADVSAGLALKTARPHDSKATEFCYAQHTIFILECRLGVLSRLTVCLFLEFWELRSLLERDCGRHVVGDAGFAATARN